MQVNAMIEDGTLVLRLPLSPPRPSTSGKTLIVATTSGFVVTEAKVDGRVISVSVNATVKK